MVTSYKQRSKNFWESFCKEEVNLRSLIDEGAQAEAVAKMRLMLDLISIETFELTNSKTDVCKYELVMSGSGDLTTIFMIDYCLALKPEMLSEKWIFHGTKPRLGADFKVEMHGFSLGATDFLIYPSLNKEKYKVDIGIFCSKFIGLSKEKKLGLLFTSLDSSIGETYTVAYIGKIDILYLKKPFKKYITLADLHQYIEETINQEGWAKLNNPIELCYAYGQKSENPEEIRNDIFTGYSHNMDTIQYFYNDKSWFKKISNFGVSLGFLFFDNTAFSTKQISDYHNEFEEKIKKKLQTVNVATLIGWATGTRNSYIDFIIYDEAEFISLIKELNLTEEKLFYRNFMDESEVIKLN